MQEQIQDTPEFSDWQDVLSLLAKSDPTSTHSTTESSDNNLQLSKAHIGFILSVLLTPDERDTVLSRMNIVYELLEGEKSQRQISQLLKVGIATVTRGSNQMKSVAAEDKERLKALFESLK